MTGHREKKDKKKIEKEQKCSKTYHYAKIRLLLLILLLLHSTSFGVFYAFSSASQPGESHILQALF